MNRFLVDLKSYMEENGETDVARALDALGRRHRDEIWGGHPQRQPLNVRAFGRQMLELLVTKC